MKKSLVFLWVIAMSSFVFGISCAEAAGPIGTFDAVSNNDCRVIGWAKDPDSTKAVSVHIYENGPYPKGSFLTAATANLPRTELPYPDKYHGFSYDLSSFPSIADGHVHEIYIYGIDATGDPNAMLALSPKNIQCKQQKDDVSYVNAKDAGAKGDGLTDDAPALQRAVDSLGSAGGTIFIPAGTYMLGTSEGGVENFPNGNPILSAVILRNNNITFRGSGSGTVLKLMGNKKMRAISVTGQNVTVENLTVDGNKSLRNGTVPYPGGDVVDALVYAGSTSSNVRVQNCEVRNGIEDGIGFWRSEYATVTNCYSHDNGTPQAGASGISLSGVVQGIAEGNRSINNTIGIWSAYGSKEVTLRNNELRSNRQEGIIIGGFGDVAGNGTNNGFTIVGNTVAENGSAGFAALSIASAQNGTIDSNTIINNEYDGVQFSDDGTYPDAFWNVRNNICSNTSVPGKQDFGIRVLGLSHHISLEGNTCRNNGTRIQDQIVSEKDSAVNSDWKMQNRISYDRGAPIILPVSATTTAITTTSPTSTVASTTVPDSTISSLHDRIMKLRAQIALLEQLIAAFRMRAR
jgi:hypothetical protein